MKKIGFVKITHARSVHGTIKLREPPNARISGPRSYTGIETQTTLSKIARQSKRPRIDLPDRQFCKPLANILRKPNKT